MGRKQRLRIEPCEFTYGNYCIEMKILLRKISDGDADKSTLTSGKYKPCMRGGEGCPTRDFYLNHPQPKVNVLQPFIEVSRTT